MIKQCHNPKCGVEFETDYPQKEYCTVRCRRTAKDQRQVSRDGHRPQTFVDERERKLANPTVQQMAALALLYAAKAEQKPTRFTGIIPEFIAPAGVLYYHANPARSEYVMREDCTFGMTFPKPDLSVGEVKIEMLPATTTSKQVLDFLNAPRKETPSA